MGCIPSKPKPAGPQSVLAETQEAPRTPKPFDSNCTSLKDASIRVASIELESPILSLTPATPSPTRHQLTPPSPPPKHPKNDLCLPIAEVTASLDTLISLITTYTNLLFSNCSATTAELSALLPLISENSLIYTKIEIMISRLNTLYSLASSIITQKLLPICEGYRGFPALWTHFLSLPREQQEVVARDQRFYSPVLSMFRMLGEVRGACAELEEVEGRVEGIVRGRGEEVFRELFEQGGEAGMLWGVLGVVVPRRRKDALTAIEGVRERRMRVSRGLMSVVNMLGEVDEEGEE